MPQFVVTSPDGKKFRINAPEGATQEQALAYAQQQFGQQPSQPRKALDPAEYDPASPEYQAKYGATSGMTWGDKFSAGVGKSLVDTGRGIRQLGAMVGIGDADAAQRDADESARLDAPLMETGGGITGNILGQAAQFAVPAGYLARGGKLATRLGRGAAFGAAVANTQPVTSDQTRLGNTAAGAIGGAAGEGLAAGVGRLAAGASDKIAPEVAKLAKRAKALGIPLRAEQVTGSRALAGVTAATDMIPFSGRDAARNAQEAGWNRALSKTMGEDTPNLSVAVRQAQTNLGRKYDAVLGKYSVKADQQLLDDFKTILDQADVELDAGQFARLSKQIDTLSGKATNGQIDARAAYNVKKMLDRLEKNPDTSVSHYAGELKNALIQGLDRSLPPDVAKSFAKTRELYSNLISLRKVVRAGAEGSVSPARLATMPVRGQLKELADIGAQFLKEPFGNSGTANRAFGTAVLGGSVPAAFVEPTAALAAAGTIGMARGTNALLQSQGAVNYALQGSNALKRITPYTNALLPTLGAVAGQ